jgi:ABC-type branched-subunit amino acid transport system ATPase component
VLRCLQLEARGYSVTVTELVGWEHSMKNELILASRNGPGKQAQQQKAAERLQQVLEELGLQALANRFGVVTSEV